MSLAARPFELVRYSSFLFTCSTQLILCAYVIGDQLETVHIERQRAQAAYDLIDYYNQFSKGDTSNLDTLRKEGRAGRRKVAVILRRLTTVAREVDLPNSDKTRETIDKYCEKFEKEMLNLFDRCYRKGDPKMMHVCGCARLDSGLVH